MRTTIGSLLLRGAVVVGMAGMQACAQYRITVPDSDPIQLEGQESEYVRRSMNAYFWGSTMEPQVLAADCQGEGINDLVVERSYDQDLISVFTLGIWMPFELRYRCKAPPTSGSMFPAPKPETPRPTNMPTATPAPGPVTAAPEFPVPQFPWPPPLASATAEIPDSFVRPVGIAEPTLGDVDKRIRAALDAGGYFERSYFAAPGGFAMVTRLEQINPDGTSKEDEAERWAVEARPLRSFSLADYLRALFTAPSGHYRIIVFVISSQPFAQSAETVGRSEAIAWLSEGLNRLPDSIAQQAYTDRYTVTALIYEFEQPGRQEALLVLPGNLMGRVHLQRAMLWDAFSQ